MKVKTPKRNSTVSGFIETILRIIFEKILKLSFTQEQYDSLIQFVKFGIVGLSNTIISYVVYIVTLLCLQTLGIVPAIDYLVAQFMGFLLSVLWSFYWNNKVVFQDKAENRNWLHTLLKTYISYAFTGIVLNSALSLIWVEVFHWSKLIAPIINLTVSVPLNFILNKFWVFKSKH